MNAMVSRREANVREKDSTKSPEIGWRQKAIANCYFHSPAPRVLRPLRDQYRLTVSRTGKLPRVSFEKRTEPSARILYYHRVNDDNDAFFPAITTVLFEAQMRYVSRHYRVVSLAELVRRLGDQIVPAGDGDYV